MLLRQKWKSVLMRSSWWSNGLFASCWNIRLSFPPSQQPKDQKERNQRKTEKQWTALAVNHGINHIGTQMNAELGNGEYSEAVTDYPQRNNHKRQDDAADS